MNKRARVYYNEKNALKQEMYKMKKGPVTFEFEELVSHKASGKVPEAAIAALRLAADKILTEQIYRPTERGIVAPSGDPHDYASYALYRWPNPDTPDGLPWIPRDGVPNPGSNDVRNPYKLSFRMRTLSLAAFYFEDGKYSDYAKEQLYDWFINPETRMNPNARFAQAIPGVCEGRSTGLIDFACTFMICDAVGILECMGRLSADISEGVRAWFVEFADWMLTHENGIEMGNARNNIGAWYDVQILAMAVFTGRSSLAKSVYIDAYEHRVKRLIMPDGSQPTELSRTKPIHYSLYTLMALRTIADIAKRFGYTKYWQIDDERGECVIKKAIDFLYPFVKNPECCPYPDLCHGNYGEEMARNLRAIAKHTADESYLEKADGLARNDAEWLLLP